MSQNKPTLILLNVADRTEYIVCPPSISPENVVRLIDEYSKQESFCEAEQLFLIDIEKMGAHTSYDDYTAAKNAENYLAFEVDFLFRRITAADSTSNEIQTHSFSFNYIDLFIRTNMGRETTPDGASMGSIMLFNEPELEYREVFFIDYEKNEVRWMYYNPDSTSNGQIVTNHLDFEDIVDIAKTYSRDYDFFNHLQSSCRQYLADRGTECFEAAVNDFLKPAAVCVADEYAMKLLTKAARRGLGLDKTTWDFTNDRRIMRDFLRKDRREFLQLHSYLNEQDYTAALVNTLNISHPITFTRLELSQGNEKEVFFEGSYCNCEEYLKNSDRADEYIYCHNQSDTVDAEYEYYHFAPTGITGETENATAEQLEHISHFWDEIENVGELTLLESGSFSVERSSFLGLDEESYCGDDDYDWEDNELL